MAWNVSEARNRLSEILSRASIEGPQTIQRRNERFIVLTEADYQKLTAQRPTFKDWLLHGPTLEGLEVSRGKSAIGEV